MCIVPVAAAARNEEMEDHEKRATGVAECGGVNEELNQQARIKSLTPAKLCIML